MSKPVSISKGIAARYSAAVFELAKEEGILSALEADAVALSAALSISSDLREMIASPILTREQQNAVILALGKKMGLSTLVLNTLSLMAQRRRLFVLPQLAADILAKIADERGEMTAEVTAATALSAAQTKKLTAMLKTYANKEIKLKIAVDETLIGGLVIRLGSTMIDTSMRAKLMAFQNAMKEVG